MQQNKKKNKKEKMSNSITDIVSENLCRLKKAKCNKKIEWFSIAMTGSLSKLTPRIHFLSSFKMLNPLNRIYTYL